jgi:hypothetical protein
MADLVERQAQYIGRQEDRELREGVRVGVDPVAEQEVKPAVVGVEQVVLEEPVSGMAGLADTAEEWIRKKIQK